MSIWLSASQIKTFRECPRKWGFSKIDRVPRTESGSAKLGTRVHEIAEDWLTNGRAPDEDEVFAYEHRGRPVVRHPGRIFVSGLHLNPPPATEGLKCEGKFTMSGPRGSTWIGFIDLRYDNVIQDHKTSSDPRRYGLTEEDMLTDPQCVLYAEKGFRDGLDEVTLRWVYYPTKPPYSGAYVVERTVTREDMAEGMAEVNATALEIIEAKKKKRALDLAPNRNACNNYGGCPHWEACERNGDLVDNEIADLMSFVDGYGDAPPPIPGTEDTPPPIPDEAPPIPTETVRYHADGTKEEMPPIPVEGRRPKAHHGDIQKIAAMVADGLTDASAISIELDLVVSEVHRVLSQMSDPINPPEAPEPGGEGSTQEGDKPEVPSGDRSAWKRAEWKALAMHYELVDSSCRYGEERLKEVVEAHEEQNDPGAETDAMGQHAGFGLADLTDIEIALIKAFREVTRG